MVEEVGRWKLGLIILEEEERKLVIVVSMVGEEVPYSKEVGFIIHMLNKVKGWSRRWWVCFFGGRSFSVLKRAWGDVGGVENKSSMGSMLMAKGEEFLDGWVRADGGEVKGGGVDFGVTKSFLGEIPEENMRESDESQFCSLELVGSLAKGTGNAGSTEGVFGTITNEVIWNTTLEASSIILLLLVFLCFSEVLFVVMRLTNKLPSSSKDFLKSLTTMAYSSSLLSEKRCREDKDKDEDAPAGSDQGLKQRKTGKDAEPTKSSKLKETKSISSKGTKSQPKSSGKSAQAEEPVFETTDTEMP
nr:hypothetical protein [Tanacetum cinerariifolium]